MTPEPECLLLEISPTGPQWQVRIRVSMGRRGALRGHGQIFCSKEFAELLATVLPGRCHGRTVSVIDRTGPEAIRFGSFDERS